MKLCLPALAALVAAAFATPAAAQWGNITGKITLAESVAAPPPATLELASTATDRAYCLSNGPLPDEAFVVNPKNRGIKNAFVYLKEVKPDDIHQSYPKDKDAVKAADEKAFLAANGVSWDAVTDAAANGKIEVAKLKAGAMIDQQFCVFVPHALFVREGQRLLVKNPEPCAHNFNMSGFDSDANKFNQSMPPKTVLVKEPGKENGVVPAECNAHGWMKVKMMVLDHPYCAVTDADGSFTLKNVKAGTHKLVVRNADGFYFNRGLEVVVAEGKDTDASVATAKLPPAK